MKKNNIQTLRIGGLFTLLFIAWPSFGHASQFPEYDVVEQGNVVKLDQVIDSKTPADDESICAMSPLDMFDIVFDKVLDRTIHTCEIFNRSYESQGNKGCGEGFCPTVIERGRRIPPKVNLSLSNTKGGFSFSQTATDGSLLGDKLYITLNMEFYLAPTEDQVQCKNAIDQSPEIIKLINPQVERMYDYWKIRCLRD